MPRARKAVLIWTATAWLLMIAVDLVPAEPALNVSPAWERPAIHAPNKQFTPGIRIGYPASLADRYSR